MTEVLLIGADSPETSAVSRLLDHLGHQYRVERDLEGWLASPASENPVSPVILAGPLGGLKQSGAVQKVHSRLPGVPVLAACQSATVREAVDAMRLGAANLLLASDPAEDQAAAIEEAIIQGGETATAAADKQRLNQRMATLTRAEIDVLDELLAGLANKQIAQKLSIGLRTVELRRSKIMRKMQAKSLSQLVKFICVAKGFVDISQGESPE